MRKISTILIILIFLLIVAWLPLYYFYGVDPFFVAGLIRSKLTPTNKVINVVTPNSTDRHGHLSAFKTTVYASSLPKVTAIAFQGKVLYAAKLSGEIVTLIPNSSGQLQSRTYFSGLDKPLGIVPIQNNLIVAQSGKVTILTDTSGKGVATNSTDIVTGLPSGRHQTDSLALGPDGKLYIGQGSTSDRGEFNIQPLEASILRTDLSGGAVETVATGLRNPYGLAFNPVTKELFATDNGQDIPSFGVPDELNLIIQGGNYGWPNCWGNNEGSNCKVNSVKPVALLQEHASADGIVFYTGDQFPDVYKNNLFIAEYGANSGDPSVGKKIVRVTLTKKSSNYISNVEDFATGFDHPISLVVGPEGCLYVADFGKGEIDRICAVYN